MRLVSEGLDVEEAGVISGHSGVDRALFLTTEAVVADKPEKEKAGASPGGDMGGMDF